jgi:hypothetical protein
VADLCGVTPHNLAGNGASQLNSDAWEQWLF